jgi:hypothetical protein
MFTILVDTREKLPWKFPSTYKTTLAKLDSSDYTIDGMWEKLAVERKKSVSEISGNLNSSRWKPFLEKLADYPHKFIICEFSYDDILLFPSKLPFKVRKKIKVRAPYIFKCLSEIEVKYGISICLCGNRKNAQDYALAIMKRVWEKYR